MKIIFCDTNIVYGLFCRVIENREISNSILLKIIRKHDVYLSTFVFRELLKNYNEDFCASIDAEVIEKFIQNTGFKTIKSRENINLEITMLISDPNDLQILQDAVTINADFLITKNIKDFDVEGIDKSLHIKVVESIPLEILETLI